MKLKGSVVALIVLAQRSQGLDAAAKVMLEGSQEAGEVITASSQPNTLGDSYFVGLVANLPAHGTPKLSPKSSPGFCISFHQLRSKINLRVKGGDMP